MLPDILGLYLLGFQFLGLEAFFSSLKLHDVVQAEIMHVCSTCGEFSGRFTGMPIRSRIKDYANVTEPS